MNTVENNVAVKLEVLLEGAHFTGSSKVLIPVQDAADLLAYIAELEAKVLNRNQIVVGDEVAVIRDDSGMFNWVVGRTGIVVEVIEDDGLHPLVIEFPSKLRVLAHYTEVVKITEEPVAPASKFVVGQKVETLKEVQQSRMVVKAGTVGTVLVIDANRMHEFEVMFSGPAGTFSFGYDADELKAV